MMGGPFTGAVPRVQRKQRQAADVVLCARGLTSSRSEEQVNRASGGPSDTASTGLSRETFVAGR